MPAILILTAPQEGKESLKTEPLVVWGARFAKARNLSLEILYCTQGPFQTDIDLTHTGDQDDETLRLVQGIIEKNHDTFPQIKIIKQTSYDTREAIISYVRVNRAQLLVVGTDSYEGAEGKRTQLGDSLIRTAPCDVIFLDPAEQDPYACERIIVPVPGPGFSSILKFAVKIAGVIKKIVTAIHVEADVGKDARAVGQKELDRQIKKAGLSSESRLKTEVIFANRTYEGMKLASKDHDLIFLFEKGRYVMRALRLVTPESGERKMDPKTAIAVYREASAVRAKTLLGLFKQSLSWLPPLEFEQRIDLYERLKNESQWSTDFMMMLALSACIASLGLMQNSAAVIIGGMLVAPLMVPMIGAGLALIQGNPRLFRKSAKAITLGFLVAFAVSFVLGVVTPMADLTTELLERGAPNLLDLIIAFLSGAAAAYAFARPSLFVAIAGVAVAAALVPPIAASGISLGNGHLRNAEGAALLFITNLIAIVLGSATVYLGMGVTAGYTVFRLRWVRRVMIGLIVISVILSFPLITQLMNQLSVGKPHAASLAVTHKTRDAVKAKIKEMQDVVLVQIARPLIAKEFDVVVILSSKKKVKKSVADEIAEVVRGTMFHDTKVAVYCLRSMWEEIVESDGEDINMETGKEDN